MDALIITVAGTSSRFSKSLGYDALKCIYYEGDSRNSLIERLLNFGLGFDNIIIVGGYRIKKLKSYITDNIPERIRRKIEVIDNPHFADRGSGWSLHLAVEALKGDSLNSIVFAEGDLFLDETSFNRVCESNKDVITCNRHIIDAAKSVAFYCDVDMHPHYIYDTSHGAMEIKEPFTRIYNSGQVWRFADPEKLFQTDEKLSDEVHSKTNLELINEYYSARTIDDVNIIQFQTWINCNTVDDYRKAFML